MCKFVSSVSALATISLYDLLMGAHGCCEMSSCRHASKGKNPLWGFHGFVKARCKMGLLHGLVDVHIYVKSVGALATFSLEVKRLQFYSRCMWV